MSIIINTLNPNVKINGSSQKFSSDSSDVEMLLKSNAIPSPVEPVNTSVGVKVDDVDNFSLYGFNDSIDKKAGLKYGSTSILEYNAVTGVTDILGFEGGGGQDISALEATVATNTTNIATNTTDITTNTTNITTLNSRVTILESPKEKRFFLSPSSGGMSVATNGIVFLKYSTSYGFNTSKNLITPPTTSQSSPSITTTNVAGSGRIGLKAGYTYLLSAIVQATGASNTVISVFLWKNCDNNTFLQNNNLLATPGPATLTYTPSVNHRVALVNVANATYNYFGSVVISGVTCYTSATIQEL